MVNTVRDRLEWLKKEKNIRDKDIADFLGITTQAVQNWRYMDKIPPKHIEKTCEFLGVHIDWLLEGKGKVWSFEENTKESFDKPKIQMAIRFYQEMERLNLSIADVAKKLNTNQEEIEYMILGYKEINALYLANLVKHGFDINYILIGVNKDRS